jgi:hypothetical protein
VSGKLPLAYAALFEIYGPNSFWLGTFLGLCMNKYSSKIKQEENSDSWCC